MQGCISDLGVLPAVLRFYHYHMRDSNTVVASGIAGIVCSTEGVGLREDFKEEAEQRLSGVVLVCLRGINVQKKDDKSQ